MRVLSSSLRRLSCSLFSLNRVTSCQIRSVHETNDPFERYCEIDNSNEKRIQHLRSLGLDKDDWIATEKVHGANFGVYSTDFGKSVRYSKRSGIMPHSEHFFGYHALIPELVSHITHIRELLCASLKENVHTVILNGELFGGKYTHPAVPRSKQTFILGGKPRNISAVQTDSFPQYSPNLHFFAFDIKYRRRLDDDVVTLTFDAATSIFELVKGLLFARPIMRGPLDKICAFDVESFQTTIPPLVGMGNYPLKGNWAEGLVVKHSKRGTVGWDPKGPTILKFKCVAFQEISTDKRQGPRFDQMENVRKDCISRSGLQLPRIESVLLDNNYQAAAKHLLDHICERRLQNLISKIGTQSIQSRELLPGAVAEMLARDAMKDFLKDAAHNIVVNTPISLRREFSRYVLFESRKFVSSKWESLVDNANNNE